MSSTNKSEIPAGLKNRPGLNNNQRLPSINGLLNRLNNGATSSSKILRQAVPLSNNQVTRGGVTKRVFKPNIPSKQEPKNEHIEIESSNDNQTDLSLKSTSKSHESKKNNFKSKHNQKDFIQIEGTFEGFKSEPKSSRSGSYLTNGHSSSTSSVLSSSGVKRELTSDNKFKLEDSKKDKKELRKIDRYGRETEDYLSDDLEEDISNLNDEDMPISWTNYSMMINKFSNLNKIDNNIEDGRLILMPCIFGNVNGDTGYKLQVLKSGKMRLVDKKSGFTIDLLNTGELEHDAIKEVVELDDDKLLRYGSLKNSDIYSPVRSLDSDYNSILQD